MLQYDEAGLGYIEDGLRLGLGLENSTEASVVWSHEKEYKTYHLKLAMVRMEWTARTGLKGKRIAGKLLCQPIRGSYDDAQLVEEGENAVWKQIYVSRNQSLRGEETWVGDGSEVSGEAVEKPLSEKFRAQDVPTDLQTSSPIPNPRIIGLGTAIPQ